MDIYSEPFVSYVVRNTAFAKQLPRFSECQTAFQSFTFVPQLPLAKQKVELGAIWYTLACEAVKLNGGWSRIILRKL